MCRVGGRVPLVDPCAPGGYAAGGVSIEARHSFQRATVAKM